MGEGDFDLSNSEDFTELNSSENFTFSCSMDSLFDEMLENSQHHACTHTHTCNPPGPDLSHTHTCFHAHTRILPAPADETAESAEKFSSSKKRPSGNKESVRKYREKKKAHTASLEEEVIMLKMRNQQLVKRLQKQASLEAEVSRLKCLLVDLRGRIDGEIGTFPYQRHSEVGRNTVLGGTHANVITGAHVLNSCGFHCDDQCTGNSISGTEEVLGCEGGSGAVIPVNCLTKAKKVEGFESEHKQHNGSDAAKHS